MRSFSGSKFGSTSEKTRILLSPRSPSRALTAASMDVKLTYAFGCTRMTRTDSISPKALNTSASRSLVSVPLSGRPDT